MFKHAWLVAFPKLSLNVQCYQFSLLNLLRLLHLLCGKERRHRGAIVGFDDKSIAKMSLFSPITLRDLVIKNRIWVSPMCQYSCKDGTGA